MADLLRSVGLLRPVRNKTATCIASGCQETFEGTVTQGQTVILHKTFYS